MAIQQMLLATQMAGTASAPVTFLRYREGGSTASDIFLGTAHVGEYCLLVMYNPTATTAVTAGNGWTHLGSGDGNRFHVFGQVLSATETIGGPSFGSIAGRSYHLFFYASATSARASTPTSGTTSPITANAVAAPAATTTDAQLGVFWARFNAAPTSGGITAPPGMTQRYSTSGNPFFVLVCDRIPPGTTTSGLSATYAASGGNGTVGTAGIQIVLES